MGYSGNHPRFSRKEEMIHDRELIYDAKQQLHRADEAYKSSPANYGTEHSSPVAMTDAASYRSKMAKHWSASNPSFDMPIMHDEAGRKGEGSPAMMNSPLHESKAKEGVKKGNSAARDAIRKQASSDSERAAKRSLTKVTNANAKASAQARAKSDSERAAASRSSKMASIKGDEAAKEAKLNKGKPKK